MKLNCIKLSMLFLILFFSGLVAQIPHTLSYQGVLTDSAGYAVADGQHSLFFSIYDQESGSHSLWDEWQDVVTENGVFGAYLGSVVPINLAFDKPYWLEIEYNGDVLTPRSKITASAYSLNTADIPDSIVIAEKIADGNVVRSFNGFTDAVAIAAGANITLTPQGNTLIIAATDSIGGGGAGNSPWLNVGNGIAYTAGDIGMGTNTPKARVHSHQPDNSTRPGFYSVNTSADYSVLAGQPLQLGHWNPNTSVFNERMRITRFGNVGIGTTAPNARLGVENDGTDHGIWINQLSTTGFGSALQIDHSQGLSSAARINAASGSGAGLQVDKAGGSGHAISALQNGSGSAIFARQWGSGAGIKITNSGGVGGNGTMLDIDNVGQGLAIDVLQTDGSALRIFNDATTPPPASAYSGTIDIVDTDGQADSHPGIRIQKDDGRLFSGFVTNASNAWPAFEITSNAIGKPALEVTNDGGGTTANITSDGTNFATTVLRLEGDTGSDIDMDYQFVRAIHLGNNSFDVQFRVDGDGRAYSDEGFTGSGADFAEMVKVAGRTDNVEPGDVMVISASSDRAMEKSTTARSTLVMGIYSTKPGFIGSERDWSVGGPDESTQRNLKIADMKDAFNEVPLAVVGIVPCKVSAENGSIRRGDLLVTAATPGHAMRDDDPKNGTIVGKALGTLDSGTGMIKVLVTLQ